MKPEEIGLYWIKMKQNFTETPISDWIVAYFDDEGRWWEFGSDCWSNPDDVVEIGPKIEEPK